MAAQSKTKWLGRGKGIKGKAKEKVEDVKEGIICILVVE